MGESKGILAGVEHLASMGVRSQKRSTSSHEASVTESRDGIRIVSGTHDEINRVSTEYGRQSMGTINERRAIAAAAILLWASQHYWQVALDMSLPVLRIPAEDGDYPMQTIWEIYAMGKIGQKSA